MALRFELSLERVLTANYACSSAICRDLGSFHNQSKTELVVMVPICFFYFVSLFTFKCQNVPLMSFYKLLVLSSSSELE